MSESKAEGKQCPVCRFGVLEAGSTTMTFTRDTMTLVVKRVPALVCESCGEAYTSNQVTENLTQLADRAFEKGVEVEVRRYSEEALRPMNP